MMRTLTLKEMEDGQAEGSETEGDSQTKDRKRCSQSSRREKSKTFI
jgi:hypothetical protein